LPIFEVVIVRYPRNKCFQISEIDGKNTEMRVVKSKDIVIFPIDEASILLRSTIALVYLKEILL
jgi:hypothetical protein